MDTRSSSGSGSRSANLNPNSKATYTTAGTVYNPQTAPPLQPPARRGRATRWPPANPTDLSAFSNSVLGGFPRSRYRSPPTTASTLRHYSPLQQNQDRALDPRICGDHHRSATSLSNPQRSTSDDSSNISLSLSNVLPRELLADELPKAIVCNDCGEQFQTMTLAEFHASLSGHDHFSEAGDNGSSPSGGTFAQDEKMKEEEDLTQFNNYSVKTLTNLASYPNPNQKMAQRCLDRARETFKAAAENMRSASPSSSQPDLNGINGASASSYFSNSGRESSEYYSRVPRNARMNSSTRSSVLSSGPGAPQPLTAGPPGQRHYKASTLEGPLRALQESAQKPDSLPTSATLFGTNPPSTPALSHLSRPSSTRMPEASRAGGRNINALRSMPGFDPLRVLEQASFDASHSASGYVGHETRHHGPSVLPNQKNIWTNGMRETKTQNELREYYPTSPGGVPFDYDPATFVNIPGDNSDLQLPQGRILPSSVEAENKRDADLAHHRKRFYEGDSQVFRPWEHRFDEIRNQARDCEEGRLGPSGPLTLAQIDAAIDPSQLGKPRDISISLINQLKPHDAARPILPMLCSTLTNLKNDLTSFQKPPEPKKDDRRVCPRPGYIGQEREEWMRAKLNQARPQTPTRKENSRW